MFYVAYTLLGVVSWGLSARAWGYKSDDLGSLYLFGLFWPVGLAVSVLVAVLTTLWWAVGALAGWDE